MPDVFTGKLHKPNYFTKLSKIFQSRKQVGAIQNAKGNTVSTSISLFVPNPTDVRHVPGIFLAISNGNGATFARIDMEELHSLIEWMQDCSVPLFRAFEQATIQCQQLRAIDKAFHSTKIQTPEVQQYQEDLKEKEQDSYKTLMSAKPFDEV